MLLFALTSILWLLPCITESDSCGVNDICKAVKFWTDDSRFQSITGIYYWKPGQCAHNGPYYISSTKNYIQLVHIEDNKYFYMVTEKLRNSMNGLNDKKYFIYCQSNNLFQCLSSEDWYYGKKNQFVSFSTFSPYTQLILQDCHGYATFNNQTQILYRRLLGKESEEECVGDNGCDKDENKYYQEDEKEYRNYGDDKSGKDDRNDSKYDKENGYNDKYDSKNSGNKRDGKNDNDEKNGNYDNGGDKYSKSNSYDKYSDNYVNKKGDHKYSENNENDKNMNYGDTKDDDKYNYNKNNNDDNYGENDKYYYNNKKIDGYGEKEDKYYYNNKKNDNYGEDDKKNNDGKNDKYNDDEKKR